jgi:hypothetical protein
MADNIDMEREKVLTKGGNMIQWVTVLITLIGLAYNGVKDYQKGEIQLPTMPQKQVLTKPVYPVQYCVMAYDPNLDRVFYLHENGKWYDYAPQQRRYESSPQVRQQNQVEGSQALGNSYGSQGASGYRYGQSTQASAYTMRR